MFVHSWQSLLLLGILPNNQFTVLPIHPSRTSVTKTSSDLFQDWKIKATIVLPSYMNDHYNCPKNQDFIFVSASSRKVQCVRGCVQFTAILFPSFWTIYIWKVSFKLHWIQYTRFHCLVDFAQKDFHLIITQVTDVQDADNMFAIELIRCFYNFI